MVVDSRPDLSGVKSCERLTTAGIPCSYVYINSGANKTMVTPAGSEDLPLPNDMLPHPIDDPNGSHCMTHDPDDPFDLGRGPRSSSRISGTGNNGGPGGPGSAAYRSHIVRLNSIEPNTVMFSTKDYPILSDITVPEIIDELEKQFDDKLCDLQAINLLIK